MAKQNSSKRTLKILLFTVVGMFAFAYALVPLYRVFCQVTGLNGRIYGAAEVQVDTKVDPNRVVTVQFLANKNEELPWDFYPNNKVVKVHPGELTRVSFHAKNRSGRDMTVQAIPSITPSEAVSSLKKTECFCFTQQTLAKDDEKDMPIIFHIDKDLDPKISTLTLSYTLFDTKGKAVRKARKGHVA